MKSQLWTKRAMWLPEPQTTASSALKLRDYQRAAVDAVHEALGRGVRRQLISLPTGAGKTFVAAHLVSEIGRRTVFMVHRDELARQTVTQMRQVNPALSIGVCKAEQDEVHEDIVVASAQTLAHQSRLDRLVAGIGPNPLFISDECHHDRSPARMRAIDAIVGEGILVGLTATPKRGDKLGLDAVYDEIVYHLPMRTLVERKHLARPVGLRIETESDLDSVHTVAGEFNERELANEVDTDPRNRLIVESWKTHAADRKRTVVFCVTVRHAERVRDAFRAEGISAEMVDGGTPVAERQRIFAEFAKGDLKVLTNCMVLTEGFDEPGIDCAIMARPTKSSALYIQCVGRALRFRPDKPDALIIDLVDVTSRHQLVTLPSLSGSEIQGREREVTEADRKPGQAMDLFDALSHNGKLREREAIMLDLLDDSPFVWQALPDGTWMSPAGMGRWVTLLREGEEFVPVRIIMDRGEAPALERLLDRPVAADIAMGIASDQIPLSVLNQREAHWRGRPATEKQKAAAARWRVPVRNGATAGELSDLIDMAAFRAAQKKLFGRAS